jgi:anti-sigma regulatory factor (Ser/Thr protein kinase)
VLTKGRRSARGSTVREDGWAASSRTSLAAFGDSGFGDEGTINPFAASLPPDPALLFDFRGSLREWLRRASVSIEDREALVLAVHEAVANGIDHGTSGAPIVVAARLEDGDVIVEITTAGSWEEPPRGRGSSGDLRGWGLPLMRGLSKEFEILVSGEFVIVRLRSPVSASSTTRSTL